MEYQSNTKEQIARLSLIKANIAAGVFSDALVTGLNAGMALMKRRIFNQSLDARGETLGPYYSEQYARDRRRDGRQTSKKDLENTGSLRRAIEVVTVENTKAEIRIVDLESADIARWQEQQIANLRAGRLANDASGLKVPIFELNETELEVVRTTTRDLIRQKFEFI
jgi:hypothetical protein